MQQMNEQQRKKIAGYLGIAQRAGKIAAGDNMVKDALHKNRVKLLVLADDASAEVRTTLSQLDQEKKVALLDWQAKTI